MSKIFFLFTLFCVTLSFDPLRLLPLFRRLDAECSNHGFLYKSVCYCTPEYSGPKCETRSGSKIRDDPRDMCDNIFNKLDLLANISPENYPGDDFLFSRFNESTIGAGDKATYGNKPKTWIKMHDATKNFQIFLPGPLKPTSVVQRALGDCYLLAGLAALANSANGDFVREAFNTPEDNANHVYVTRWLINGKPRFVAVDDWVPGDARGMAFAQNSSDGEFWAPILEKAWAKIHGSYMAVESGWHTEFWHGITQAPIYTVEHSSYTAATLFDLITAKTSKGYPVGAGTSSTTNLAGNHAYAVLKTFDLNLSNGRNVKLVKCFNPWRKDDDWTGNPWGDKSTAWTAELRQLTGQTNNAEDGVFFLSPEDYYTNFDSSDWVTARRDYDVSFVDVPIDSKNMNPATYTATFTVNNPSGDAIYVYIDKPNTRLFKTVGKDACPKIFRINNYKATSGTEVFNGAQDGEYVVKVYKSGSYKFEFSITNLVTYNNMITITAYGPKGSVQFDKQNIQPGFNCGNLKNCNFNGICNTYDGTCQCYLGWGGADCSQKKVLSCPNNCNGKGTCDSNTGVCTCDPGFAPPGCTPCPADKDPDCASMGRQACLPTDVNYKYAQQSCSKYCGDLGYPGFAFCSKLCRVNSDCKNGGTCDTSTGTCKCPGGFLYPNCDPCEDKATNCYSALQNTDCVPGGLNYAYAQQSCMKFCGSKGYPGFGDCSVLCKSNSDCPNDGTCNTATGACKCAPGYLAPKCDSCTDLKDCSRLDASYCDPTSQNFNYMKAYCQKFCGSKGKRTGFEECYIPPK